MKIIWFFISKFGEDNFGELNRHTIEMGYRIHSKRNNIFSTIIKGKVRYFLYDDSFLEEPYSFSSKELAEKFAEKSGYKDFILVPGTLVKRKMK